MLYLKKKNTYLNVNLKIYIHLGKFVFFDFSRHPVVIYYLLPEAEETSQLPTTKHTCAGGSFEPVDPNFGTHTMLKPRPLRPIPSTNWTGPRFSSQSEVLFAETRKESGAWCCACVGFSQEEGGVGRSSLAVQLQPEQQQPLVVSPSWRSRTCRRCSTQREIWGW